jgi:hypothetical protein
MNSQELRIGNYVIYEGSIEKIQCGEQIDCNRGETIKPIPLTEQWLLDFKFDIKTLNNARWYECSFDYNRLELISNDIGKDGFSDKLELVFLQDVEANVFVKEIKHVHTLQNLYYALTQTELTLNNN